MSLQKQIIDFANSHEYKALNAYYNQPSIFNALGVSRHENTHSNFLAWLLTPKPEKNDHGLGEMPLRKLLETIALICSTMKHAAGRLDENLCVAFLTGDYALSSVSIEREKYVGVGRIDIYIEGEVTIRGEKLPLQIAVENKIKSVEHDSQTRSYQEALEAPKSRPSIFLGIYLTPLLGSKFGTLEAPECEAQNWVQMNYQHLADYVIAPCRDSAPSSDVSRYLKEYLLALSLPEFGQNKGDIKMAVNIDERALLARFWEKHKDLLTAAILAMSESDTADEAERETIRQAAEALSVASPPDRTRYSWRRGDIVGVDRNKGQLVWDIVNDYVTRKSPPGIDDLKTVFPDALLEGSFCVVAPLEAADASNFKGHKRYYTDKVIRLASGAVAVCNQWRRDNIGGFIKCAEALSYEIRSTE